MNPVLVRQSLHRLDDLSLCDWCEEMELTPDRGWSEPRFISMHSSCLNTGNLLSKNWWRADASVMSSFAPAKQFIKRPPE